MAKDKTSSNKEPLKTTSRKVKPSAPKTYEPPKLTKFEKLEKLIVCGE